MNEHRQDILSALNYLRIAHELRAQQAHHALDTPQDLKLLQVVANKEAALAIQQAMVALAKADAQPKGGNLKEGG